MRIAVNQGEQDDLPIRDCLDVLQRQMNCQIEVDEYPIHIFLSKVLEDDGSAAFDVMAYAPLWSQQVAQAGMLTDLGPYAENTDITTTDTLDGLKGDFFDSYLDYGAWFDQVSKMPGRQGKSSLLSLPGTHTGVTLMMYRADLMDNLGEQIPQTWEEYNELVKRCYSPKNGIYGTAVAGDQEELFPVIEWYARLTSQGAEMMKGNCGQRNLRFCSYSEEGIRAYEWIRELIPYMPPDTYKYTVRDCAKAMCDGKIAVQLNVSSFVFPQCYYSKNTPYTNGFIQASEVPGYGDTKGRAYGGGWSWGMKNNVSDPVGSWKLMQLLSSRELDRYRCIRYGITPIRRSTLLDVQVQAAQPWTAVAVNALEKATAPDYFYLPEAFVLAALIKKELVNGLFQSLPGTKVLKELDRKANEILKAGGWQCGLK